MGIKRGEWEKLFRNPIFIVLIGIFLIYNVLLIYNNSNIKDDLERTNELISEFGYKVDEDMLKGLENKYEEKMEQLNEMTERKFHKTFSTMDEFLISEDYKKGIYTERLFSEDDKELISELSIINLYKNVTPDSISKFENLNASDIAERTISMYGLKDEAADLVRKNYEELGERLQELKGNGEHKNLYFFGEDYETQELLYKKVIGACLIEIMILVVLGMSFLVNYERENKTLGLVSTTKRGRKFILDKLFVGLMYSILVTAIILGVTLIIYFTVFDYSKVWNVPISSALNCEGGPHISWHNLTVLQNLIISIGVVFIIALISGGISFCLGLFLKSSYKAFFTFFVLFGALFMMTALFSVSSPLVIWSNYNIFVLALNPQRWFAEAGAFMTSKHYVTSTLLSNGAIVTIFSLLLIRRFKKADIV
ncbi:ABC transporter permease subunit [Clostridium perfringens]|nr:ABC transporter permease subunit [Clostridium perfringens]